MRPHLAIWPRRDHSEEYHTGARSIAHTPQSDISYTELGKGSGGRALVAVQMRHSGEETSAPCSDFYAPWPDSAEGV